ncbi:MAG: nucleoside deaminase [Deferribacterota bacterium]|nr:nucleoside deaminase [Deferribacterota bacterium]
MNFTKKDIKFFDEAIKEANIAYSIGEVPVGAVVVLDNKIISRGYNMKESTKNPLYHAEIVALKKASEILGDWRLNHSSLYVTLEPCIMCCGAIIHFRVEKVFFCLPDEKFGGVISNAHIFDINSLNHRVSYYYGYNEEYIKDLLKSFFRNLRKPKTSTLN